MFSENKLIKEYILKNYVFDKNQYIEHRIKEPTKNTNNDLPKMPNILNNKVINNTITYKYLDDNMLAREFSNEQDFSKDYLLKFCLFNVNTELETPFLEYFLNNNDELLDFPETILLKDLFIDINKQLEVSNSWLFGNNKTDIDKINETIENVFLEQIINVFNFLTKASKEDGLKSYRGFMNENKYIYVFFDCSKLEIKNNKFIKCVLPELLNTENTNLNIDNNIVKLFEQNKWLINIKDLNDNNIENPNIIYLCDEENDEYVNILNNENEMLLIYPKIEHKIFGYIYVFTETPINKEQNIKRFVSFYNKELPTLDNLDTNYTSYYLMNNDKKYLILTNEEQFIEL